jgi:polyisoprenoid-binding protein YceI
MATTQWSFDPTHSELGFKIKHLMLTNVSGSFKNFQVDLKTEGDDFTTAQIVAKADMNSISTNNDQRDAHLRTSDFFEAEKYPEMVFQSTRVEKVDDETLLVRGDLTLKGITKPVTLTVEHSKLMKDPWGGERTGFVVTGKIKRSEWGVTFNGVLETGGVMLGEEVKIYSEIQFVKTATAVAA